MADNSSRIRKPVPFDELPPPEIPPALAPMPPSPLRVVLVAASGQEEVSVVYKQTYTFQHGRRCELAEEQPPLEEKNILHDELVPGVTPSYKTLPELVGYKTGTDVVVQGSARSARRMSQMQVGVEIAGKYAHRAEVFGPRFCDHVNGKVAFTPPEPFEEMPLRYENAYGGRDRLFEAELLRKVEQTTPAEDLRRVKSVAGEILQEGHPLMYPRNRFGKGYVLEDRKDLIEGRELPNLEWPNDRLTPGRLVVGNPLDWNKQPLPVGFGYLDLSSFPRCSMVGLPPATTNKKEPVVEVARGLIPADFCRGNIFTCKPEDLPKLIHPSAGRCASLGLWLPFLRGNEPILLDGMDPEHPRFLVQLPGETPVFTIPGLAPHPVEVAGKLHLVCIDLYSRLLTLIWAGRTQSSPSMTPDRVKEMQSAVKVNMRKD
jgi:hypothetical protein